MTMTMTSTAPHLHSRDDGARGAEQPAARGTERPRWDTEALLRGASEAVIEHRGSTYRLRVTGLGKLILTK
jgi:hemin uptake protein HemP